MVEELGMHAIYKTKNNNGRFKQTKHRSRAKNQIYIKSDQREDNKRKKKMKTKNKVK